MSNLSRPAPFFIGWDVGGWNCDRNSNSRDALLILDANLAIVGRPWRGNLRLTINEAVTTRDWIGKLFSLCAASAPPEEVQVTLAIDTPLGFSEAFVKLVTVSQCVESVENSDTNPYLFRQTERFLFEQGLKPLSAIKDMIGSQATKGMHVLAKFIPEVISCGVWSGGNFLTALESYPSACRRSATIQRLRQYPPLGHEDLEDALTCALVAYLFVRHQNVLKPPQNTVPDSEGWIWVPKDAFE